MRAVRQDDLAAAARALLAVDEADWADLSDRILAESDLADRYRKRLRRLWPGGLDGTIMSAALAHPHGPPLARLGRREARAMIAMLAALERWRDARDTGPAGQRGLSGRGTL